MDIQVNGIYGNTTTAPDRTVQALFGDRVLYTVQTGQYTWDREYKTCGLKAFRQWAEFTTGTQDSIHMSFLNQCREIVAAKGATLSFDAPLKARCEGPWGTDMADCQYFMDDRIVIVVHQKDGQMTVGRLPVQDPERPHLDVFNPIILTDESGKSYRFHGEFNTLIDHVNALLAD